MIGDAPPNAAPLALDSPRWPELLQSHGTAEDIPKLIEALTVIEGVRDRAELWFGIWATLCPDGRVYSAAFAAVPHLLAITHPRSLDERVAAMHVAAGVEIARHEPGAPAIPDDLVPSYATAIESLAMLVSQMALVPWDAVNAQILAAALLAGKRQPALARAMLAIGTDG